METSKHASYHPSVERYYYVLEIKDRIPAKRSYLDKRLCAEEGLRIGQEKYGKNLLDVYVMKTGGVGGGEDRVLASWSESRG